MAVQEKTFQLNTESRTYPEIERIFHEWDSALAKNDADALLALYAENAELQSPLIPHLMGREEGVCRGKAEIKALIELVAKRKPKLRQFYRTGYFTDGRIVMWEYPHETPAGDQMDFVEVMEIENGLIKKHRVYWGWFGVNIMKKDEYRP